MIHEFNAQILRSDDAGSFTARLAPFGEAVPYGSKSVEFAAGSITVPQVGAVPLTVDHSGSVLDRIGILARHFETDDGMYGEFTLADTETGRDVRELLRLGAITDVSVGVELDEAFTGGVMSGKLDHVAVVTHGRFGKTAKPSKVLAVHEEKEHIVPEETAEATAPVVEQFDDTELRAAIAELAATVDDYAPKQVAEFGGMEIFEALLQKRAGVPIANHAIEDVVGDLGAADASGVAPNTYWGAGLQHKVDRRRPLFATGGSVPFPASGYNLDIPEVTQDVLVDKRGAEKTEANSRALHVVANSFPIQFFDGAVDVALEIISQSDPAVLDIIASSLLSQYAAATERDAQELIELAATLTGAELRTDTYANLVEDIITASDLIQDTTGLAGDMLGVTPTQWIQILSLMDGGDRRQFAMINPQNADGTGSLTTRGIDVGGVFIFRAPYATVAVQYNQESYKNGEKTPMQVQAENVELMGRDVGLLGATVNVFWDKGIYAYKVV